MLRRNSLILGAALAMLGATGAAQARSDVDVQWSVTIGSPGVVRAPRVVVPAPVIVAAPVVVPAYPRPPHGRAHGHPVHRIDYRGPRRGDADGDGIPNRHDRVYNPRWDVDGDGVPNRYDRRYNPRWDMDGDGIPNRHDRMPRKPGRYHED